MEVVSANLIKLFVPVMPYICYIVVIIQKIKDSLDILKGFLICQFNSCLRDHGNLCLKKRNTCGLKSLAYCT